MAVLYEKLSPSLVNLDLKGRSREEIVEGLVETLVGAGAELDPEEAVREALHRERLGGTGLEAGVALPHAKLSSAKEVWVAFGRSKKGVDFGALDGVPARLFFLVLGPKDSEEYLVTIAHISRLMSKEELRKALLGSRTPEDVISAIKKCEEAR